MSRSRDTADQINRINSSAATATAITIDSSGAITKPSQPAFLAQVATAQSNLAGFANVAIFGTEIFDQNADYEPSTGIFTAPVTGKYMLSTMLRLEQIATTTPIPQIQFATSNRNVYAVIDPATFAATTSMMTFTQSLLMDMDSGDTAKVQVYIPAATTTVDISTVSWFSGYLVA